MVTKDETNTEANAEVKIEAQKGNSYELVFIIHPEVADDALDPLINGVTQYITGKDGEVIEVARWGRKKLAYPIKHLMEGNYVLVKFRLDPAANRELENNLKISEKVLRYLLIKIED